MKHSFRIALAALALFAGCETIRKSKEAQEALEDKGRDDYVAAESEFLDLTDLGLEDLVGFGIANRPDMAACFLELDDARLALQEIDADAPLLSDNPWHAFTVDASAGFSESADRSHGLRWAKHGKASAALSVDLLLWDWGRNMSRALAQSERIIAAEHSMLETGFSIFEEVSGAYFNVLGADALLEIAYTNELVNAVQVERAQRRLDAGETQLSDLLQAKKNLAQAKEQVVVRKDAVKTAGAELVKVLGLDVSKANRDDILADIGNPIDNCVRAFPDTDYPVETAFEYARTNSPAVRIARARLRASSKMVDAARADLLPRLSLSGSINWTDPLWWWSWGANLTQNLFSGFGGVTAVDRAVVAMQKAALDVDESEQQLSRQLSEAIATRDDARVACASAEATYQAARENFEVVSQQYLVGECNQLDYADAVNSMVTALGDRVQNFYAAQIAEARLFRLLGEYPNYIGGEEEQ